uniref:Uncharacterized protein n=1 Tax=Rhizophora mucronata TaxID=61149 RepID=A0A2P2K1X1_RHIMU
MILGHSSKIYNPNIQMFHNPSDLKVKIRMSELRKTITSI